jgi:hypothetical protein
MNANVDFIAEFAQGLRYQVQFRDQRMLNTLEHEGADFLRGHVWKRKRSRSQRGETPTTSEKSTPK